MFVIFISDLEMVGVCLFMFSSLSPTRKGLLDLVKPFLVWVVHGHVRLPDRLPEVHGDKMNLPLLLVAMLPIISL